LEDFYRRNHAKTLFFFSFKGIAWDFIEFPDNKDVLELIDQKTTGILSVLTDTCRTPRGTDKLFVDAMYKQCDKHVRFLGTALHKGKGQFIINHYAGPVMYDTESFVEKNKDETPRGTSTLLESSSKQFVQLLGKITGGDSEEAPAANSRNTKKRPTVGGQFSSQLTDLLNRVDKSSPHYVRCLKPNQSLKADQFDHAMIADQLRYAGVLEAIRVSRIGYSQRYSHKNFIERYGFIAIKEVKAGNDNTKVDILVDIAAKKIWENQNPNTAP
jgi:myosin-5